MQRVKISLILFISMLLSTAASAHFIWIDTAPHWKLNSPQEIKVYYGEYSENLREAVDGRFAEVKDFTLWIISPDGVKKKLDIIPAGDHYKASYTPVLGGRFTVEAENTKREVVDWTTYGLGILKANYYATAYFRVEEKAGIKKTEPQSAPIAMPNPALLIIPGDFNENNTNREVMFTITRNGVTLPGQKMMIHAPNGWSKELEPDNTGVYRFIPLWEGKYIAEAIHTENVPGTFSGKPYASIRHRAIYSFVVK